MKFQVKVSKDDQGCFKAWCEEIPGAISYSFFEQEAVDNVKKTIESYAASFDAVITVQVQEDLVRA